METLHAVFSIAGFGITRTVIVTWALMAVLTATSWLATRRLVLEPGAVQTVLEGVVGAIEDAIAQFLPDHARLLLPFVGTLWIFIAIANLLGILPTLSSPTADLATTVALAIIVFLSVHWYGIRSDGLRAYLAHYLAPNPIMLPFHIVSEISRTVALAVRLFGNVMSLEMAAMLILLVAGFLVPVPILMLHIVEGLVQAYIFGMLTLVYIAGGIHSRAARRNPEGENA
ncbi:MAG: F0F1 ATP synthase subunit A [Betaproteobacteria bacterium]|nr:F0F1 ATP synthase subunit A [Betaproteobacteria bacterium]